MDTFLKIDSTKQSSKCNCLDPFFLNKIDSVNKDYGRIFNKRDVKNIKSTLYRVSNNNGCQLGVCCDPNDSYENVDQKYLKNFIKVYPNIKVIKSGGEVESILLSKILINEEGWIQPTAYHICKISKSKINNTKKPYIKIATNLVKNCFTDSCDNTELLNFNNIVGKSLLEESGYTAFDDSKVAKAIENGDINFVKEYIRKYKHIDNNLTHNNYGNRLLHEASKYKNDEIMELLLALKPDINIKNVKGHTPLHIAVKHNNYDNAESLIKLGAEIKVLDIDGNTPIFHALTNGNIEIARLLYSSGSGVLNKNNNNDNTLHHVIKHSDKHENFVKIVRFLLDRGVSTDERNKDGKTPLELVKDKIVDHENKESFKVKLNEDMDKYHQNLLEVQTSIFNSTILNNPLKYKDYINAKDIPKGAPIEVLDTLCVGDENITGNESSEECVAKGGKIIKVKEPSTQIKLSLIQNEKTYIDEVDQKDLYLEKQSEKKNDGKQTDNLKNYNKKINPSLVPKINNKPKVVHNSDHDKLYENGVEKKILDVPEHPIVMDEESEENIREKKLAMQNSNLLKNSFVVEEENEEIQEVNSSFGKNLRTFNKYKLLIMICVILVMIVVIYILVKYLIPKLKGIRKPTIKTI